ncbi:undecaprenyl-phosphate galactose phosphotransferase/putative colanic acid biosynthesis UDP-glucose lipid carrier transferase [Bradyrhizobium sp. R2.2-H]|uniref:undecaprenyl-phosphate glucose phosphotransferase n=1 Tax=unclassified Bradyrhizobium TaxID=2631580 RepID=UPI0010483409|nr:MULTISPECIES: undecaprenyl-phosphate glucose phosphotransferase [unclassified Bradyrhizobium]TCU71149.1 undecaprenyl-phosphate galactose phosphotransferase/putative colanic acid biosynthesis UDP-glucose lipid carrier transferase [Bradyrhizobium sp. Y-H1]TCU73332.1 undecaprenyl-phosphate galactose phosphotransferase/putative colanic acid biosynthesis UDP-glucose lipid carrier transferase [Bradyrhizobium sp. R2.2-H]
MSLTTYGSKSSSSMSVRRGASLQRPLQFAIMAGDFLLILLSYAAANLVHRKFMTTLAERELSVGVALLVATAFVAIAFFRGCYDNHNLANTNRQLRKASSVWLLSLAILVFSAFLLRSTAELSRITIVLFAVIGLAGLGAHRVIWRFALASSFARRHSVKRRVVLISGEPLDFTSVRFKDLRRNGFQVVRHFVLDATLKSDDAAMERELATIIRNSRGAGVDEFLLAFNWRDLALFQRLSQSLRQVPNPVRLLPDLEIADLVSRPFTPVGDSVVIEVQRAPLSVSERALKRSVDICLASLGLLCLAPLLAMTALLVRLDSPGSIIFRQTRRGFNGELFDIWKFRSMTVSENGSEIKQASKQDARVTRVGRILRKTSIDELPQLWNVLRGEMSLVGPRPHALAHDNYYDQLIGNYACRRHVKPGLTGWAQVNGLRGETPTIELMKKRVEYDVWYVTNWSIWLDIRIMIRTVVTLSGQDVY